MKVIDPEFEIGDIVYLKTDREQLPRIVYCYRVYTESIIYDIASGTITSSHYSFEISKEQNVLLATSN